MTDDRRVAKSRRRAHHLAAQTVSEIRREERPRLLVEAPGREADFAAGLARLRAWLEQALAVEVEAWTAHYNALPGALEIVRKGPSPQAIAGMKRTAAKREAEAEARRAEAAKREAERMARESAKDQHAVTDQLGAQVRRAVEVLIQTLDRIDRDRGRKLLVGVHERQLYEAAVTVMMRLIFLFAAEERGLLLLGHELYDQHYAVSTLRDQLQQVADRHGEEVLERRYDAWSRLLATFRAVHGGVRHQDLQLPAYGGSLFDPDRFPFLEGRLLGTRWRDPSSLRVLPLAIDNRTVLHLLRALQMLEVRGLGGSTELRRLSFRALDVEQIGHVYEGLLDHTAKRAEDAVLSLAGAGGNEPEVEVSELERHRQAGPGKLLEYLTDLTGRQAKSLEKALQYEIPKPDTARWLRVCDNRSEIYKRVEPWAGLVRRDATDHPVVFNPGAVFVTEGSERRATGTHYTPRSLTEPIVQHTLDPLVYEGPAEGWDRAKWRLRSPKELLALRVCDFAMGSGAFLVQACRYLGERLVESWERAEHEAGDQLLITPEGELSKGSPTERVLAPDGHERLCLAKRYVVDRCLYGVDKNPMAVEMAKLSLWLETLQRDRPFSFVDHALRSGDSLLGVTDLRQLLYFHVTPKRGEALKHTDLFRAQLAKTTERAIEEARGLRGKLESFTAETLEDVERKQALFTEAQRATADLRLIADALIAGALASRLQGKTTRDSLWGLLAGTVGKLLDAKDEHRKGARSELRAHTLRLRDEGKRPGQAERSMFHWALEFPEVFDGPHPGFDAFVGNPPFMGGLKLETAFGTDYRAYLVHWLGNDEVGVRGTGDLCAYFFLRVWSLLRDEGCLGLVATNTIAQGDSQRLGLAQLSAAGATITRAVSSRPWPGGANLEVAHVWLRRGTWNGPRVLDEEVVPAISSMLALQGETEGRPYRLKANAGKSFLGSIVLGMGFVLEPTEALNLIKKDPRNREVLFPYLNGEDLNSQPNQQATRWVINFRDWPLEKAETYPDCMAIVREKVKPERDRLVGRNAMATRSGTRWWLYAGDAKYLYATIAGMERVLATGEVAKHVSFAFEPVGQVFSHMLIVFAIEGHASAALMQSSAHEAWARQHGSTLKTSFRYTPTNCFETFPFPPSLAGLEAIGHEYHEHRAAVMQATKLGLTKTYNRFHSTGETSADITRLRALHVAMDRAVADAYGWRDLALEHGFHQTKQGTRYTISERARREVLTRLLQLNHARYAEEVAAGLHESGKKKPAKQAPAPALPATDAPREGAKKKAPGRAGKKAEAGAAGEQLGLLGPTRGRRK